MSDKPKIYAFCSAGCKWETVHRDEFQKSATWIKQYPVIDTYTSRVFEVPPINCYKIRSPKTTTAYTCEISISYIDNGAEKWYTFSISEIDRYRSYFYFEILSLTRSSTALTIVYEVNGNRYSETVDGTAIQSTENSVLKISGATEVYLHNDGASIAGEKGDSGNDGATFTPHVSDEGVLSWTNDGGKENPASVNIKGAKGDSGVATGTVNSNTEGTSDTDGYTQQAVNKIASRPNLLINPDFSINQRGQKSYSGTKIYTVDRWETYNNITFDVETKTITNNETTSQGFLMQFSEDFNTLYGKNVALSCLIGNVRYSTSITVGSSYSSNQVIGYIGTSNAKFELGYNSTKGIFVQFRLNAGTSAVVDECKLEIGSVATAFVPPLIAEELPKCQRYYQRYNFDNNMPLPLGVGRNANIVSLNFHIPKMRTSPTFTTSGTVKLLNSPSTGGLALTYNQYYDGMARLFISTAVNEGSAYAIAGESVGYYSFDAEIY